MNEELFSKLKRYFSVFDPFFYISGRFVKTKCRTFLRMAPKLRLLSNKLEPVIGKWYKVKNENRLRKFKNRVQVQTSLNRLCNFCNLNAIEDEFHFLNRLSKL